MFFDFKRVLALASMITLVSTTATLTQCTVTHRTRNVDDYDGNSFFFFVDGFANEICNKFRDVLGEHSPPYLSNYACSDARPPAIMSATVTLDKESPTVQLKKLHSALEETLSFTDLVFDESLCDLDGIPV